MAIQDDGTIYQWGANGSGQLGNGNTSRSTYAAVAGSTFAPLGNRLPSITTFTATTSGTSVPTTVNFVATGTDSDGTVSRIDFYHGDVLAGSLSGTLSPTLSGTVPWEGVTPGAYTLTAVVYDSAGASAKAVQSLVINVPEDEPLARRYNRGSLDPDSDRDAQSFVIPLDFQTGVKLDLMGNMPSKYASNKLPWFMRISRGNGDRSTRFHLEDSSGAATYPNEFENPIAAFGADAGASALYTGRTYRFGINPGFPYDSLQDSSNDAGDCPIRVRVYDRVTGVFLQTFLLPVPRPGDTQWDAFTRNGFQWPIGGTDSVYQELRKKYGLEVKVRRVDFLDAVADPRPSPSPTATPSPTPTPTPSTTSWGTENSNLIVSHRASSTRYGFIVEAYGKGKIGSYRYPFAVNQGGNPDWDGLYALSFDNPPPWRSEALMRPQFNGKPMPAAYVGKSVPELLNKRTTDIAATLGAYTGYLALDTSEELRAKDELDDFAESLTAGLGTETEKALAISNYVINEVHLTDAIGYPEASGTSVPDMTNLSIFAPGMKRNAYSTYLEGQGSPWEQCALLVYMLRSQDIPAAYIIPPRDAMKMLDVRLSSLLGFQVRGVTDQDGNFQAGANSTQPTLIPTNWPWVAAYINGKWTHIFPWMKDVEISEGYDPYDFMPDGYETGPAWLEKYILGDSSIFSLEKNDDTPRTLFVEHLKKQLRDNHPNVSFDDVGMQVRHRKLNYASFNEMPTPFEISGTANAVALLNTGTLTSNLFDTVKVTVSTVQSATTTPIIETGTIPVMDMLDRRTLTKFSWSGTTLQLTMVTEPYRPEISNTGNYVGQTTATMARKQTKTVNLNYPADLQFRYSVELSQHRRFWQPFIAGGTSGTVPENRWENYLGLEESRYSSTFNTSFGQGDLGALVLNVGKVTPRKIEPHFRELLAVQQDVQLNDNANSQDEDVFLGDVPYLFGMSYFQRVSESWEELGRLHKTLLDHIIGGGLAKMVAKRGSDNRVPYMVGIDLIQPYVDMPFSQMGMIGNGTTRPDSGAPGEGWAGSFSESNFVAIAFAESSAQEHNTLNKFFNKKTSISTMALLRIAMKGSGTTPGVNILTAANYETAFDKFNNNDDLSFWNENIASAFSSDNPSRLLTKIYTTPGQKTGADGAYVGIGTLVFKPGSAAALIGPNRASPAAMAAHGGAAPVQYNFSSIDPVPTVSRYSLVSFDLKETENHHVSLNLLGSGNADNSYNVLTSSNISTTGMGNFLSTASQTNFTPSGLSSFSIR